MGGKQSTLKNLNKLVEQYQLKILQDDLYIQNSSNLNNEHHNTYLAYKKYITTIIDNWNQMSSQKKLNINDIFISELFTTYENYLVHFKLYTNQFTTKKNKNFI